MTENPNRPQHSPSGLASAGKAIAPSLPAPALPGSIPLPPAPVTSAVNFHIDRLVLHGFSAVDRHRIGAAMQAELTRLFAEQGVPPSLKRGGAIDQLDGGAFELAPNLPPRVVGVRIARSIYQGLGHE